MNIPLNPITVFKVRHKSTGLFWGGSGFRYSEKGKTWSSIGQVKLAIKNTVNYVEYTKVEKGIIEFLNNHDIIPIYIDPQEYSPFNVGFKDGKWI